MSFIYASASLYSFSAAKISLSSSLVVGLSKSISLAFSIRVGDSLTSTF
jgi:hypothetical protein